MNDLINKEDTGLQVLGGFGIEGLEDVPVSILPVPFLRLVQPSSKNIELVGGKEASTGSYFYNDTKEEVQDLRFVLLRAKIGKTSYEIDGEVRESTKLNMLGFDLDRNKVFILTLSVMSISNFGKLVANMKQKEVGKTWEYEIKATSIKTENKKGKFWIAEFELGGKVDAKTIKEMDTKAKVFGVALNRDISESEVVEVEVPKEVDVEVDTSTPLGEEVVIKDLPF